MTKVFQIKSILFTAGGVIEGTVVKAAPIIKYMAGWTEADVKAYCQKKGWYYEEVKETKKSLDKS